MVSDLAAAAKHSCNKNGYSLSLRTAKMSCHKDKQTHKALGQVQGLVTKCRCSFVQQTPEHGQQSRQPVVQCVKSSLFF